MTNISLFTSHFNEKSSFSNDVVTKMLTNTTIDSHNPRRSLTRTVHSFVHRAVNRPLLKLWMQQTQKLPVFLALFALSIRKLIIRIKEITISEFENLSSRQREPTEGWNNRERTSICQKTRRYTPIIPFNPPKLTILRTNK